MADAPAWATNDAKPAWATAPAAETAPAWASAAPTPETPQSAPSQSSLTDKMIGTTAAVADIPLSMPSLLLQTGAEIGSGAVGTLASPFTGETPKEVWKHAREAGETAGGWLSSPVQKALKGAGVGGKGYEESAPAWAMGKVSQIAEKGAKKLEEKTGVPADYYSVLLDTIMSAGGVKAPDFIKERLAPKSVVSAEERMAGATPTGAEPKPEWVTPKGKPESAPVPFKETVGAKARKTTLKEGEFISDPHEGDLGPLPPIEAYKPSEELHQEVQVDLSNPELFTGEPAQVETARDVAAEKVKMAVTADRYRQSGAVNKTMLGYIGSVGAGAAAGAYISDDPIKGAFEGAAAGFAMARVGSVLHDYGAGASLRDTLNVLKPSVDPMRKAAADVMNAKVANVKAMGRSIGATQRVWLDAKIPESRAAHLIDLYETGQLTAENATPKEIALFQQIDRDYGKLGTAAQQAGVIPRLIQKYFVPHMWDMTDKTTKAFFDELLDSGAGDVSSASSFTSHALRRAIPSYAYGIQLELKPLTRNPAEILGLYANSVIKATENANALYTLKSMKLPDGHYAVEPIGSGIPRDYITDHKITGLEGFAVHPEMVDALRRGFDDYRPGAIQKAMLAVSFAAKRLAVSYSMFHPMSLLVAYTGAGGNPLGFVAGAAARGAEKLTGGRIKIPFKSAVDAARDQYLRDGSGDVTDFAIRNGLELGTTLEDTVGRDQFLKMTGLIDKALGGDVTGLKPFTKADEAVHQFTWGYLHTGMKLAIFQKEFEKALIDPKNMGKDVNQIAADVASYTNNIFGGLNWERVVEGMRSKAGRAIAGSAYSKHGRAVLQTVAFAPDWLMSTMRSWTQAVPGLGENAAVAKLSRAYITRSLLYTMVITDALNLYYSGHHVWENDFRSERKQQEEGEDRPILDTIHDMTYIDMGDGTKVEANKHLFEFVHAITEPSQFGMGKLSSTVTDPLNMAMNRQWLSPDWSPRISEGGTTSQKAKDYAKWMLAHHAPISLQQLGSGAYGGTFGFPRHGKTSDERADLREKLQELKDERGLK